MKKMAICLSWFIFLSFFTLVAPSHVISGVQYDVDDLLKQIDKMLQDSLNAEDWQNKYNIIDRNIDYALRKLVDQGGIINSNPVVDYYNRLQQLEKQRLDAKKQWDKSIRILDDAQKAAIEIGDTDQAIIFAKRIAYAKVQRNSIDPSLNEITKRIKALEAIKSRFIWLRLYSWQKNKKFGGGSTSPPSSGSGTGTPTPQAGGPQVESGGPFGGGTIRNVPTVKTSPERYAPPPPPPGK